MCTFKISDLFNFTEFERQRKNRAEVLMIFMNFFNAKLIAIPYMQISKSVENCKEKTSTVYLISLILIGLKIEMLKKSARG
jgi:hypothetical protein